MLRLFPALALLLLIGPAAAGLAGAILPAFGYLPALGSADLSLEPLRQLAAMPGVTRSALLSFGVGLAATAISFALVILFVAGWRGTRLFRVLERLVSPLLSVPHAAAAFGLALLIAPSGLIFRVAANLAGWDRPPDLLIVNDRLGLAMTAGLVIKEIPFLLLMTLAALPQARAAEMARMAASLGYGRIVGFLHAVLPALYRQLRLPVLAVLAYATSVVDVALILGPTTPSPLAVRILQWANDPDLGMRFVAAAGAVLHCGITGAALLVWLSGEAAVRALYRVRPPAGWRGRSDRLLRQLSAALVALSAALVGLGLLLLAVWSVAEVWRFPALLPADVTLKTWDRMFSSLAGPLLDTLVIGVAASLLALGVALGVLEYETRAGRTRAVRALPTLYVPLLVPQIAFLFGLQVLFSWLLLDGTLLAVVLVHLVFVFPYVLLSLGDPWRHWDPRFGHVARALGHGADAVFWRVRLPMMARAVLTAAAVGFAVSVGLYLPTLLIGAGRWPTVTTEAVSLASGGDPRLIGATALTQALLPFLGFALALIVPAFLFRNRRLMRANA